MKKFILFFVLFVILLIFGAFFYNVWLQEKEYYAGKETDTNAIEANTQEDVANPAVYKDYTKEDYDKAVAEGKFLILFFTANWCEDCREQDTVNLSVLSTGLFSEPIVGLKVHILDSETTTDTDALAKKYGVNKENSLVVIDKKGVLAWKYVGSISENDLKNKILSLTGSNAEEVVSQ